MKEARLGYCSFCDEAFSPVFYDDKKLNRKMLSHGECEICGKKQCVSDMSMKEYFQLPISPPLITKEVSNV